MRTFICLIASLCVLGFASAQDAGKAPLAINWEQSLDNILLKFDTSRRGFDQFVYNTTNSANRSVLRLHFKGEQDNHFVRLHLPQLITPESTLAEATDTGLQITLEKSTAGLWSNGVLHASETPIIASVPVTVGDNPPIQVDATEFEQPRDAILRTLQEFPYADSVDSDTIDQVAQLLQQGIDAATPDCLAVSFCVCSLPLVFNGRQCVDGSAFLSSDSRIISPPPGIIKPDKPDDKDSNARYLSATEVLALPDDQFVPAYDALRVRALEGLAWPRALYAQSFDQQKILALGASLQHVEPIIFASLGASVTVVDPNADNLKIFERVLNSTRQTGEINVNNVNLVQLKTAESWSEVGEEFDVVMVLDSLTRAPVELSISDYEKVAQRLKIGGRWLQLGPSRTRWVNSGRPLLNNFGYREPEESSFRFPSAPPSTVPHWQDWLDVTKLTGLLHPMKFQTLLVGDLREVAEAEAEFWIWVDAIRTE